MTRQLADFEGRWTFTRMIDAADGKQTQVNGGALWSPYEAGLLYEETGEMLIPGQMPLHVTRRYLWHADLHVDFDDGRFFHKVPPKGGAASHWCDPDQYDGVYDFTLWPEFMITWQVKGPRKNYKMQTRYRRAT